MELTHLDETGAARMVDVGEKAVTRRTACAQSVITMKPETLRMICEDRAPKGDVFACARIAGIMAAKKTSELCAALRCAVVIQQFRIAESQIRGCADIHTAADDE